MPLSPGWEWGLIPAVPVPFRGRVLAEDALQAYATWMAGHQVAGVAVWAHTGRGPHLSSEQRRRVLAVWRGALPMSPIVAGVTSVQMAAEAKAGVPTRCSRFRGRTIRSAITRRLGASSR